MDLLIVGMVVGTFIVAWLIGFISGHSRGKVEAYEEFHGVGGNDAE